MFKGIIDLNMDSEELQIIEKWLSNGQKKNLEI
jgi:hypothetical protein